MTQHLFHSIGELLRNNTKLDGAREEPTLFEKLSKGNTKCNTKQTLLGWYTDTVDQVLTFIQKRKTPPPSALSKAPPKIFQNTQTKNFPPPGPPAQCGTRNYRSSRYVHQTQHTLKKVDDRHVILTPQIHNELNLWQIFITSLASRPTNLWEIIPHHLT